MRGVTRDLTGHALRVFRMRTLAIQYPDTWGKPAILSKENSHPVPGGGGWGLTLIGALDLHNKVNTYDVYL